MVHSAKRFALWILPVMSYIIVMSYIDRTSFHKAPLWIFLNVFATGFNLTFETFYFEVVFPLFMIIWGGLIIATE